jgi:hypothetical protein
MGRDLWPGSSPERSCGSTAEPVPALTTRARRCGRCPTVSPRPLRHLPLPHPPRRRGSETRRASDERRRAGAGVSRALQRALGEGAREVREEEATRSTPLLDGQAGHGALRGGHDVHELPEPWLRRRFPANEDRAPVPGDPRAQVRVVVAGEIHDGDVGNLPQDATGPVRSRAVKHEPGSHSPSRRVTGAPAPPHPRCRSFEIVGDHQCSLRRLHGRCPLSARGEPPARARRWEGPTVPDFRGRLTRAFQGFAG